MATGKSGYFELTGSKGVTLRINWAETYEVATNKSTVSITSIQVKSSSYYEVIYYLRVALADIGGLKSVGGYYICLFRVLSILAEIRDDIRYAHNAALKR